MITEKALSLGAKCDSEEKGEEGLEEKRSIGKAHSKIYKSDGAIVFNSL